MWAKSKAGPEPSAPALPVGQLHKDRRAEQVSVPTPEYPAAVLEPLAVRIQDLPAAWAGRRAASCPASMRCCCSGERVLWPSSSREINPHFLVKVLFRIAGGAEERREEVSWVLRGSVKRVWHN